MIGSSQASRPTVAAVGALLLMTACSSPSEPPAQLGPTVQAEGAPFSCAVENVLDMTVGEVRTAIPGSSVCLRTDAAAEYLVHGFFGSPTASAQTQFSVTAYGIGTVAGTSAFPSANAGPTGLLSGRSTREAFDLSLRIYERNVLAPRIAAARATMRTRPSYTMAVPNVGDVIQLNGSAGGCNTSNMRDARVTAVTSRAIIVEDLANPAGGFTTAEYQSIGVTFDTLVDPVDRAAFGDPTDIDGNSRVIIFYTRVVNELTEEGSDGVVEGFFTSRDLFPRVGNAQLQGCPSSNFAEIFYLLAPDPTGSINGNEHDKAEVQRITLSVIAHEYQHLINSSRRIYVNDADDFEEVWLNEGLSHIAEELLFYRQSKLTPRSNIGLSQLQAQPNAVPAFNQTMTGNFGRYLRYLQRPETTSPYATSDSLGVRGAIWAFLRYAADRSTKPELTIWNQLVNSRTSGMANLEAVLGVPPLTWFRDWSISVWTDDRVATTAQYQQPSWNYRNIYAALGRTTFPLHTHPLANAVTATETMRAGGGMYNTLGVSGGTVGGVSWTTNSPSMVVSIVRTK